MLTYFVLITAIAAQAPCACSGGSAAAPSAIGPSNSYRWVQRDPDDWQLWNGPYFLGGYKPSLGFYQAYAGGQWRQAPCPADLPESLRPAGKRDWQTTGVQTDQISATERSTILGQEVRTDQLLSAIAAGIPDDSGLPRLSVLGGSDAARGQVLADLERHASLAPYRGHLGVKAFPASHWAVTSQGFLAGPESVTLYLQEPSGRVVWRADGYPGPDELAKGLRRIRPDYRPENDPSLGGAAAPKTELLLLAVGAAVAVLMFVMQKPKR